MDTAKTRDMHYVAFNNFFTGVVMFVSNAFRSAKMNLIEK